ncbi:hypothetical protein ACJ2CR_15045 [Myxococcus faecalis]|uniref:hypothetical protein n=1 Tax=Myxococcus faecalis TaxID=3115646 RepID=UPI0038D0F3D5
MKLFIRLRSELSEDRLYSDDPSEEDTRAKAIDRILTQILHWPNRHITREDNHESGRSDYILRCPNPCLVVEAKRAGATFRFPKEKERRTYALSSIRSESSELSAAINQCREYADENGIEFGCATNGAQWIVFKAITPGEPWSKGKSIIFRGLEDIEKNFTDFWNLLSFESISDHSLKSAFAVSSQDRLSVQRALDEVLYADAPLQRNKLSTQLHPIISAVFKDLTGTEQDEVLRSCYVIDRLVQGVSEEVREIFNDTLPKFAKNARFQDLIETPSRSGALDDDFRQAVLRGDFGATILLLGGVGSGKTTFIHRFFRITAKDFVARHCVWFYVPFTDAPLEQAQFQPFIRERILATLKARYPGVDISSPTALRRIYAPLLSERESGLWKLLDSHEKRKAEVELLAQQLNNPTHCDAVLQYLRTLGLAVTIVIDNVDQRAPEEQLRLFLLAHELSARFDAVIVVALREESFFRAEQSGAFNAYHNIRYHIASPDVRTLLRKRVEYALDLSEKGPGNLRLKLRSGVEINSKDIHNFMRILNDGALKENPAISQFIDAISVGNMRAALDMFNQFMVSGSTNVEKMLDIFKKQRRYYVAEHEFIKAVMQGDFSFYKERRSPVLNMFERANIPESSNLTSPRLLEFLSRRSGLAHAEGVGFVPIEEVLRAFAEIFGDDRDVRFHANRLLERRLIESDNRQVEGVVGARCLRITRSGSYYLNTLMKRFQYLDLVSLDTPVWDRRVVHELRSRVSATEMESRVYRVEWLLQYLQRDESRSLATCPRNLARETFGDNIVSRIETSLRSDLVKVANGARLPNSRLGEIASQVRKEAAES